MSADLMVYDKSKAPNDPLEFLKWFYDKSDWNSDRDYFDTVGTSKPLADFFLELVKEYPAMNGEYAPSEEEIEKNPELESRLTDYTIDDDLIYMGFAWSQADRAAVLVEELAYKYSLGYFDMFNIHLDKETVLAVPQISREQLSTEENGQKRENLLSRIFKSKRSKKK